MKLFYKLLLFAVWGSVALFERVFVVYAQSSDILTVPALEVFRGRQTSDEIYYVGVGVLGGGLLITIVVLLFFLVIRKMSIQLLFKVMAVWLVFGAGVSAIALSVYVSNNEQRSFLRADEQALPRALNVSIEPDSLAIRWRTQKSTIGQLLYSSNVREDPTILLSNQADPSSDHLVMINFRPGENEFWISVVSDGVEYRLDGEPIYLKI